MVVTGAHYYSQWKGKAFELIPCKDPALKGNQATLKSGVLRISPAAYYCLKDPDTMIETFKSLSISIL